MAKKKLNELQRTEQLNAIHEQEQTLVRKKQKLEAELNVLERQKLDLDFDPTKYLNKPTIH